MNKSLFSVLAADVEREDQHRNWELPTEWLGRALEGTDATATEKVGQVTVSLMKNGRQFLVQGKVTAQVSLSCARTLDPAIYDLSLALFLILEQEAPKKSRSFEPKRRRRPDPKGDRKAQAQETDDALLGENDAAFDTFSGEEIELDDFVREVLLLELPMFPLRSDLRSNAAAAIRPPLESASGEAQVDPRLLPLQALADKLKAEKN